MSESIEMTPEQFLDYQEEQLRNTVPQARRRQILDRATTWTESHSWGITRKELSSFICSHKAARERGAVEKMLYIEDILEDCNFHTENGFLYRGDYASAMSCNL